MRAYLVLLLTVLSVQSFAISDDYQFEFSNDDNLERYEHLTEVIRCPKCQNNNVADSDAPIASDFRKKIFQLVEEGKSNDDVVAYFVVRYGEFVSYEPSFNRYTIWLVLVPLLFLLLGMYLVYGTISQRNNADPLALSQEEQKQLDQILRQ